MHLGGLLYRFLRISAASLPSATLPLASPGYIPRTSAHSRENT